MPSPLSTFAPSPPAFAAEPGDPAPEAGGSGREAVDDRLVRAEAQPAAFLAQVDPHFMFNALHTLATLVEVEPRRARAFTEHLADMHRYLLAQRGKHLATVTDELRFLGDFAELMRLRFGD